MVGIFKEHSRVLQSADYLLERPNMVIAEQKVGVKKASLFERLTCRATKIKVGAKACYVNTASLNKYLIRSAFAIAKPHETINRFEFNPINHFKTITVRISENEGFINYQQTIDKVSSIFKAHTQQVAKRANSHYQELSDAIRNINQFLFLAWLDGSADLAQKQAHFMKLCDKTINQSGMFDAYLKGRFENLPSSVLKPEIKIFLDHLSQHENIKVVDILDAYDAAEKGKSTQPPADLARKTLLQG